MDRRIEVKVTGSYIEKDSRFAGIRGEGNAATLLIIFDPTWAGCAKTVTWLDAKGEKAVKQILGADMLEDMTKSSLRYLCPIPPEPMAEAGLCTFVIDGWNETGKRIRSASDKLVVQDAPVVPDASNPTDPTPSQAEQLQVQIDNLIDDMAWKALQAQNAADQAEKSAKEAAESVAAAQEIIGGDYATKKWVEAQFDMGTF